MLCCLIKYLYIQNIINTNTIEISWKITNVSIKSSFLNVINCKIFWILPEHNGHAFNGKSFALNWQIFTLLTNKKLLLPLECKLKQSLFCCSLILIEYSVSAVNVESSYTSVWPLAKIKICFFLFWICTDKLISALNFLTFLPNQLPFGNEEVLHVSRNPIPYPK